MAPAHLKSAYPIESQFFDDNNDGLEESIRNSRLPLRQSARFSTAPGNHTTSFSNASKGPMNLSALPADTSREIAGVNSPAVNRLSQVQDSLLEIIKASHKKLCGQVYEYFLPRPRLLSHLTRRQQQPEANELSQTSRQLTCLLRRRWV